MIDISGVPRPGSISPHSLVMSIIGHATQGYMAIFNNYLYLLFISWVKTPLTPLTRNKNVDIVKFYHYMLVVYFMILNAHPMVYWADAR